MRTGVRVGVRTGGAGQNGWSSSTVSTIAKAITQPALRSRARSARTRSAGSRTSACRSGQSMLPILPGGPGAAPEYGY